MMKKDYVAPEIKFNTLSATNTSVSCSLQASHSAYVCPVRIPEWGETIFRNMTYVIGLFKTVFIILVMTFQ